jgi:hypothetical protein
MIPEIGEWDTVLPQYFSDCDYYRRVQLAGFELIETGLPVIHVDKGSNTLRSDPRREFLNQPVDRASRQPPVETQNRTLLVRPWPARMRPHKCRSGSLIGERDQPSGPEPS